MAITWPTTLPQLPLQGQSAHAMPEPLRSSMEYGPAKRRRRTTTNPEGYRRSITLAEPDDSGNNQLTIFKNFYRNTLADGALSFQWTDEVTGTTITLNFVTAPVPQHLNTKFWRVTLDLERTA